MHPSEMVSRAAFICILIALCPAGCGDDDGSGGTGAGTGAGSSISATSTHTATTTTSTVSSSSSPSGSTGTTTTATSTGGGEGGQGGEGGAPPLPDTTAPLLASTGLVDGSLLRTARLAVEVSATDDVEVARLGYVLNDGVEVDLPVAPSSTTADGALDLRPGRGVNELVLFAEDTSRNRSELLLTARYERNVTAGGSHTGALRNGDVFVWGRNNITQLGLGAADTTSRFEPTLHPTLSDITALEFRQNQSLALQHDGTLWVWGNNADGRLGLGTPTTPDTINRAEPTPSPLSGVLSATFGYDHTLVLLDDGTIRTFGDNSDGQLGDATTDDRSYPVEPAGLTDVIQVVGGSKHSVALLRDGTVWAWGRNAYGNLGAGVADDVPHPTPAQVPGLANVVHLASGRDHVLALCADGSLWGWGLNQNGQVGVGTSGADADVLSPTQITISGTIVAVAADGNYSFAILDDGTTIGWGQNFNGQLGIGNDDTTDRTAPSDPVALPMILEVDPGATHAVGRIASGELYTWGWSTNGSLGRLNLLNNWAYPTPGLVTLP